MTELQLFLGLQVSHRLEDALNQKDDFLISSLIGDSSHSLKRIQQGKEFYLGKFIGDIGRLPDLVLLEKNIFSILNKLLPDYNFTDDPLILLTIPNT